MITPNQALIAAVVLVAGICLLLALRGRPNDEPIATKTEPAELILEEEREVVRDYTTHEATGTYIDDGEVVEKEYTFDGMKEKGDKIVLCDYVGLRTDKMMLGGRASVFEKEVTTTISKHNLLDFETTDREKNEYSTTSTKEITVEPKKAVELLKESPDDFEYKGVQLP